MLERDPDALDATRGTSDGEAAVSRAVHRNLRIYGVSGIAVRILSVSTALVVARTLGAEGFGRYAVTIALAGLLTRVLELGMDNFLVRESTQRPDEAGRILGHVVVIQATLGALAVVAAGGMAAVLGYDGGMQVAVIAFAISFALSAISRSFVSILIALERARAVGALTMLQTFLLSAATIVAAIGGAGPTALALVALVVAVAWFPLSYFALRRRWARLHFDRRGMRETLSVGSAFSASKAGAVLLANIDAVLIQAFLGSVAGGLYAAAYRMNLVISTISSIYADSTSRSISHLARTDRDGLMRLDSRVISHLFLLGLPISVGGAILAEPLVTTAFGAEYADSAPVAALLLAGTALRFPNSVMNVTALGLGLERAVAMRYGVVVAVNLAMNLLLIPTLGIEGAAISMLVSALLSFSVNLVLAHRCGLRFLYPERLVKGLIAAAVMAPVLLALRDVFVLLPILAGGLVYGAVLLMLRTFDRQDLDIFPFAPRRSKRALTSASPA